MSTIKFYSKQEVNELKTLLHLQGLELRQALENFSVKNKRNVLAAQSKFYYLKKTNNTIVEKPVVSKSSKDSNNFNFIMGKNQIEIPIKSIEISENKLILKY